MTIARRGNMRSARRKIAANVSGKSIIRPFMTRDCRSGDMLESARFSRHHAGTPVQRGVIDMRAAFVLLGVVLASTVMAAQGPEVGRQVFVTRCAVCHGTDGNGGELGPNIATRVPSRTDEHLTTVLRQGL